MSAWSAANSVRLERGMRRYAGGPGALGYVVVASVVGVALLLYFLDAHTNPANGGAISERGVATMLGQGTGIAAAVLLAVTVILGGRFSILELLFGDLTKVYVYAANDRWIEKFNSPGSHITRWKMPPRPTGPGPSFIPQAGAVATDASGNVYVAGGQQVFKFTNAGGLAVDRADHLYIADYKRNRVQEFATDGTYLGSFGRTGSANAEFRGPGGLATDAQGDLYVADTSNHRIQKFGEPSSAFSLTKVTLDPHHGSARLIADVAGVGRLDVTGEGIKGIGQRAKAAGTVMLPISSNGITWAKLGVHGRATVRVLVTYTPTTPSGVASATKSRRITLILKRS